MSRASALASLFLVFASASLLVQAPAAAPPTTIPADTYKQFVLRIDQATADKDLPALQALGRECGRWRQTDRILYARELLYLAASLSTYDLQSNAQYGLSQKYALLALRDAPDLPLDLRLELLNFVQQWRDESGAAVVGQDWVVLREKQARLWLTALRDIEAAIDPQWDPNRVMGMHELPPDVAGRVIFGQDPASVADPELRKAYIAALEENRCDNASHNQQRWLRKQYKRYVSTAGRYLAAAYARPPADPAQLQGLLEQSGLEPQTQDRIPHPATEPSLFVPNETGTTPRVSQ